LTNTTKEETLRKVDQEKQKHLNFLRRLSEATMMLSAGHRNNDNIEQSIRDLMVMVEDEIYEARKN
jgi:uncharacterized protein YciI